MNCPYCHSEYEMIREKERQGWQCEQCWTFWTDQDIQNVRTSQKLERICGNCQYLFCVLPDESVNNCPACRSSKIKLVHPESFDWDPALTHR